VSSYAEATEPTKRLFNRAFFKEVIVKDGKVVRWVYEEPFATLLSSNTKLSGFGGSSGDDRTPSEPTGRSNPPAQA
jgi:hypothetical protein